MLNTCTAWTPVCAAESWSDFISVIVPALFGSFARTSGGSPSCVPTSTTNSCALSVTTPLPVEMP